MKNAFKITLAALVITVVALPALCAKKNISAAVERSVAQATAATRQSPLEIFNWRIRFVQDPNSEILMDAMQILTNYNQTFETEKDTQQLRKLAAKLEGPIAVPWNTYRGNGLKEIFDNYIPNSHGNKQLAQLEYYVKFYTLSQEIHKRTYLISKIVPADFMQTYNELKNTLAAQTQRNDKELVKAFVYFASAYNQLASQDAIVAQEVKDSLFKMPIQTGWDRTFSLKELVYQLGVKNEGDGVTPLSAEQIQRATGVNASDAEAFVSFVQAIRR